MQSSNELPLSPGLESRALDILSVKHPLDSPDFNTTEYINQLFPNEQSLASLDSVMDKIKKKSAGLRHEAERLTMAQMQKGGKGTQELEGVTDAIQLLFQKIQDIKAKATQSETMVQDITQDVKSLDFAKRQLTQSVTVLKRLQMLVSAVDQLELMSKNKQYKETAQLLLAVIQLMQHFKTYRSVPQIDQLSSRITQFQDRLAREVESEFKQGFNTRGEITHQSPHLPDVCRVASALGDTTREKLTKWYVDLQLASYRKIFHPSEEVSQLDNISRRFALLKRTLDTCDKQHGEIFPSDWDVSRRVSEEFCKYTKTDMEKILAANQPDVNELLKALHMTIEFETQLSRRFEKKAIDKTPNPNAFRFEKSISTSFQPYLWIYIDDKDRALSKMIDGYVGSDKIPNEEEEGLPVLASSTDLFISYGEILKQCEKLSTGGAFRDLCDLLEKHLCSYCDKVLVGGLSSHEKQPITPNHFQFASFVLNTADYCFKATSDLEEKLRRTIDEELKDSINLQDVKDMFLRAASKSIDAIVNFLNKSLDPPLHQMTLMQWGSMESVGDQSPYVNQLQDIGKRHVAILRKTIANRLYFRTFSDRFAESFLQKYLLLIFRCKPISEVGAQQMLLDTHGVRTLLDGIPITGATGTADGQRMFGKLVNKGISKVEAILKTVMELTDPPDGYVERYLFMIKDKSLTNFTRLLELKGLKKPEQAPLIKVFQQQKALYKDLVEDADILPSTKDVSQQYTSTSLQNVISTIATSASPTPMTPSPSRINENFRKFVNVIPFRKDQHERRE